MPETLKGLAPLAAGAGAGAAAEYMFDPADGKRRRHMARDQFLAKLRRGSGRDASELNDQSLEAKVESELFRPEGAPKGSVDVNVQDHVVFLRGEVESRDQLESLVSRAKQIDGVAQVESRLSVR